MNRKLLLVLGAAISIPACQETIHITLDPQRDRHPISPYIYGTNDPIPAYNDSTLRRVGGNRWTAYNWTNNASNAGSDWHYENDSLLFNGNQPGAAVKAALADASAHHAPALLTIPTNGYVSFDKNGDGDVRKSGDNYLTLRFHPEAPQKSAPFTLTPNPRDPIVYQDEFVNWIKTQYPYALTDPARPIWFALDNEPDLWSATHAEVHPDHVTYAELVQKSIAYSAAIKRVMPNTLIFAPVNYGWNGFTTLQNAPDANGHDFQEFYLDQMRHAEADQHRRLLDVLDVHWYPEAQGAGHRIIDKDNSPAVIQARLQAPRSLNDPAYTETSWITRASTKGPINLIPRLQQKIAAHYPGTKLAITEYNFGGAHDISGAIAQADALGIFGTTNLFAACEWPLERQEPFIAAAFRMYRNFDGSGSHFGDTSIYTNATHPADASAYAALTNTGEITLIAINKTAAPLAAEIQLRHADGFTLAHIYCLQGTAAQAAPAPSIPLTAPPFKYLMPSMSITMLVLTKS